MKTMIRLRDGTIIPLEDGQILPDGARMISAGPMTVDSAKGPRLLLNDSEALEGMNPHYRGTLTYLEGQLKHHDPFVVENAARNLIQLAQTVGGKAGEYCLGLAKAAKARVKK